MFDPVSTVIALNNLVMFYRHLRIFGMSSLEL